MSLAERLDARFTTTDRGIVARWSATSALELRGPFDQGPRILDLSKDLPCAGRPVPRYFLRNVTAGALEGDRYEITLTAERGVCVRVEPTSAQKVFVAREAGASLVTHLRVEAGAYVEYDAGVTILHAGASLDQATTVTIEDDGVLLYSEVLSAGRLAHGERFAFARLRSAFETYRDGSLAVARHSDLRPGVHREVIEAATGSAGAIGTLLALGVPRDRAARVQIDAPEVYAGASALPNDAGVIVQVLAPRAEQAVAVLDAARDVLGARREAVASA